MKIALIGYGKMGHAIEAVALSRGHEIVAKIDVDNQSDFDSEAFASADVAIEFTSPTTAYDNCLKAFARGVAVVSGSTGWTDRLPEVKAMCADGAHTFLWTSNFSLGVNVFFALNRYLADIMAKLPQYSPEMMEVHHIHKLDHPSGTALSLARDILERETSLDGWTEDAAEARGRLLINHRREGEVPGTHIVTWDSEVDTITIEHRAKSRAGFALGAVMAAEWLAGQRGFKRMDDFMAHLLSHKD